MTVSWFVSCKDVELTQAQNGGLNLERTLHSLGMDIRKGWMDDGRWRMPVTGKTDVDEHAYFHRSLSGHKVCGPRYIGEARQDGRWKALVSNELNLVAEFGQSAGAAL